MKELSDSKVLTYNRRGSNPENIFMIKHTNIIVCFLRVHHWQNAEFQQETTVSWIYQCGPSPPERIRISLLAHIMEKCYRNRKRGIRPKMYFPKKLKEKYKIQIQPNTKRESPAPIRPCQCWSSPLLSPLSQAILLARLDKPRYEI